ncbi:MAG: ABC transporter ATP-binding protein [Bdellovibrionales bacterium]|nr:ABC transporter ATP-binding protein [Bdellovibrionales bacterium]
MIKAQDLCKHYGDVEAVKGISFEIPEGAVVGLLGPNGAGKTTTIRLLTTFLPPTSGTATVAGYDIKKQPAEVRKHIGYLPETPPLYPEMRVDEYVTFVAKLKGVGRGSLGHAVEKALTRCSLTDVAHKLCSQLSKGYRQRVGLAQAIVHEPKVIILDEPTSGLDPAQIIEIRQLISELKGEHTVVLSTHILSEVSESCSELLVIADGSIALSGTIAELTAEQSLEQLFLQAVFKRKQHAAAQEQKLAQG